MDEITFLFIGLIIAFGLIGELGRRISNLNRTNGEMSRTIDVLERELNRRLDKIDGGITQ